MISAKYLKFHQLPGLLVWARMVNGRNLMEFSINPHLHAKDFLILFKKNATKIKVAEQYDNYDKIWSAHYT